MSFVEGHIVRDERTASGARPRPRGARPADSLVDTLATLHAVDIDAIGLGDFARRDGYIARQLKRWHTQFAQSTLDGLTGARGDRPGLRTVVRTDPRTTGSGHRARRLPARQHGPRRRRKRWPRSSTGRSAPWVTRWPISASCSSTGPNRATETRRSSGSRRPRSRGSPAVPRSSAAVCGRLGARRLRHRLLPRVRTLEARLYPPRRPRALRRWCGCGRPIGCRPVRRPRRSAR